MNSRISIVYFDEQYQYGVDKLLDGIQAEYAEYIYGAGSLKMKDAAKNAGRKYWVALDGNKVIGTVGIISLANNNAVLKSMMLHKDYRGSGNDIALRMMVTAMEYAKQRGADTLYLGTMAQFEAATAFYLKHGFKRIQENELPDDFIGNPVDVVFFRKGL